MTSSFLGLGRWELWGRDGGSWADKNALELAMMEACPVSLL